MNEKERKKEIKQELISNDLTDYLKLFIPTILICGLFGYFGYLYSKDNNEDLVRGTLFGAIFPLGIIFLKLMEMVDWKDWGYAPYIIYIIGWICLADSIPYKVGVAILAVVVSIFVIYFIYIETKDRTKEISKLYEEYLAKQNIIKPIPHNTITEKRGAFNNSGVYVTPEELYSMDKSGLVSEEEKIITDDEELDYECEMCFKKISYEEWDNYDMMCEDCFMFAHTDDEGNYHDEEIR